jgi:ribosomal protein S1
MMEWETTTGRISSLVKFGAFVDLYGIEGLIHISEIAWYKVQNAGEIFTPGEEVELVILSVDIERERISLSQKALLPSPWELFARNHHNGELVEGVVTKVVDFGAFVVVDDSIEGLLHTSEMRGTKDFAPEDVLVPGDIILVRILSIQPEVGRLALSQRQVGRDEEMEWTFRRQQSHRTTLVGEEE